MRDTMTFRTMAGIGISLMWLGFATGGPTETNALNFISEIKGDVWLKRSQWDGYCRANVGDLLDPYDRLELGVGASAQIMCSNLSVWSVQGKSAVKVSDGCPSGILSLPRPDKHRVESLAPPRAPSDAIPYVISPRNTVLLTNRPTLRWNAVAGASRYTIQVQDAGLSLDWKTDTPKTEIKYPGQPSLQQDTHYLVIVEADTGRSSEEEQGTDLSFVLLDARKAELVRKQVALLKQQELSSEAKALTLAYLYQSYGLKAEAIELLEVVLKRGSQTAAANQLVGDLYLQAGLGKEAKSHFRKAMKLAKDKHNVEKQAEAQVGLGEASYLLGKEKEAMKWLARAKETFGSLGDESKLQELDQWITIISR